MNDEYELRVTRAELILLRFALEQRSETAAIHDWHGKNAELINKIESQVAEQDAKGHQP